MDQSLEPIPQNYEDMLHQVFDQSSQGFQVIDRNWRYVFVNAAVAKQGKSTDIELMGHTMMEKYPGIDQTPLFTQLKRVMDEKVSIRMDNFFTFPDGSTGWFQLFIHPWSDGIIIFSVDITERKREEETLAEKISHLESSQPFSPEGQAKINELKQILDKLRHQEPAIM